MNETDLTTHRLSIISGNIQIMEALLAEKTARIAELEARIMELKIEWATLVNHMANFALDGNLSSNDCDECEDAIRKATPYLGG